MIFGGLIAILTAIWIYRTAREDKIGNAFYWVAGSFVVYLTLQVLMIYFNLMIIETFDADVSTEYDAAGGLNARDNSGTAGLQSGPGGTIIGIIFELLPFLVPFLAIAFIRLKLMLKQPFSVSALFGGIKEMFIAIIQNFKTAD
jgi:hypothetical protein